MPHFLERVLSFTVILVLGGSCQKLVTEAQYFEVGLRMLLYEVLDQLPPVIEGAPRLQNEMTAKVTELLLCHSLGWLLSQPPLSPMTWCTRKSS